MTQPLFAAPDWRRVPSVYLPHPADCVLNRRNLGYAFQIQGGSRTVTPPCTTGVTPCLAGCYGSGGRFPEGLWLLCCTHHAVSQPSRASWRPASRRTRTFQGQLFHLRLASPGHYAPTAQCLLRTGSGQMSFQLCTSWRTAEVKPDTMADDLRRKAMPFVEMRRRWWCRHAACLPLSRVVGGGATAASMPQRAVAV